MQPMAEPSSQNELRKIPSDWGGPASSAVQNTAIFNSPMPLQRQTFPQDPLKKGQQWWNYQTTQFFRQLWILMNLGLFCCPMSLFPLYRWAGDLWLYVKKQNCLPWWNFHKRCFLHQGVHDNSCLTIGQLSVSTVRLQLQLVGFYPEVKQFSPSKSPFLTESILTWWFSVQQNRSENIIRGHRFEQSRGCQNKT